MLAVLTEVEMDDVLVRAMWRPSLAWLWYRRKSGGRCIFFRAAIFVFVEAK